MIGGDFNRV